MNDSINYDEILLEIKRKAEKAYQTFSESFDLVTYSKELTEIILNALDAGLCYPDFDIYDFLEEFKP